MEIWNSQAYIHYNGWGTRWDEWIPLDSDRIATFRTHTTQASASQFLSPYPQVTPDAFNNINLSTESTQQEASGNILNLMQQTVEMTSRLNSLKSAYEKRMKVQRVALHKEAVERVSKWKRGREERKIVEEEKKMEEDEEEFKNSEEMIRDNALLL